jgi:hypothetical protein
MKIQIAKLQEVRPPLKILILRSSRSSQEPLRSPLRYALDFHSLAPAKGFLLRGGECLSIKTARTHERSLILSCIQRT